MSLPLDRLPKGTRKFPALLEFRLRLNGVSQLPKSPSLESEPGHGWPMPGINEKKSTLGTKNLVRFRRAPSMGLGEKP